MGIEFTSLGDHGARTCKERITHCTLDWPCNDGSSRHQQGERAFQTQVLPTTSENTLILPEMRHGG